MKNLKTRSLKFIKRALAATAVLAAGQASALALLGQEPPSNLIVQAGGLEWVYAADILSAEEALAGWTNPAWSTSARR